MSDNDGLFQVYETGPLTVVGFGGQDVMDQINLAEFREQIRDLVKQHTCEVFAFDLTGVQVIPSGLLGLLASLRRQGVEVHLYNPSDDVRDVLSVTNLDKVIEMHELEPPQSAGGDTS